MSDWVVTQEYEDDETGTRMTIENYGTEGPNIKIHPPDPCRLSDEEVNEMISRLIRMVGGMPAIIRMLDPDEEDEEEPIDEWQQHEWSPND